MNITRLKEETGYLIRCQEGFLPEQVAPICQANQYHKGQCQAGRRKDEKKVNKSNHQRMHPPPG